MIGKTYRRKPSTRVALQWKGDNFGDISDFMDGQCYIMSRCLFVKTTEGTVTANVGDYIVKKDDGFYISERNLFEQLYEEVQ